MDTVDASNKTKTTTAITILKNLDFNAPKFGIPGFPPPKLNSTFAINASTL
jgi:hypothetical protein